ncbi:hypothetical protein I4U23_004286 [Adineta vaga]|nr:hypothetical protein I4U23_004286 [Adineta vaga]
MQKYIILAIIGIVMINYINAQSSEVVNDDKVELPSSLNILLSGVKAKDVRQCLPVSCGSFGCCSGNCQPWCRACGVPHTCG